MAEIFLGIVFIALLVTNLYTASKIANKGVTPIEMIVYLITLEIITAGFINPFMKGLFNG